MAGRFGEQETAPCFRLIDLFCGAGGLSLGFCEHFDEHYHPACHIRFAEGEGRFRSVWANDFHRDAAATYNRNFGPHCLHGPIESLLADAGIEIPEADLVIGGPPCQGFSLLNRNREGDVRRELWRPFMEVVERSGAGAFVMENVPQLLGSAEYRAIERAAGGLGFRLASAKLIAADFGVPQRRVRAFILGARDCDPRHYFSPAQTHSKDGNVYGPLPGFGGSLPKWRGVRDWIGGLGEPAGSEIRDVEPPHDLHFGRRPREISLKRYRAIPEEGMNRFDLQRAAPELTPDCWKRKTQGGTDLFGRLWWDQPAFTIRTEFYKPEKGRYLHPEAHRPLTHREAARLQGFPDWFRFSGSKMEIAKQIGNAVPPPLAARVADCVYEMLREIRSAASGSSLRRAA
jgi:DNA (cytosine-5)-methyltransferase 1